MPARPFPREATSNVRIFRFFSKDMVDQIVLFGRAVGCGIRLELLQVLGDQGLTVTQAAAAVGVSPSTAFYHYKVLIEAGLVKRKGRRRGCRYVWPDHTWDLVRRRRTGMHEKPNELTLEPV